MGNAFTVSVGRVRVTQHARTYPSEAGYIGNMKAQMKEIIDNLQKVIDKIEGVTPQAILYALQPAYDRSQELVPVDTGALKASGFLEITETSSGTIRAQIGYGRHGVPYYAAYVHEMVHIPRQRGKSARFLALAIEEKIGNFQRRLVNYMRENSGLTE